MSTAEIALPQIKFRAAKARIAICNLFVVPVRMWSTCTFSVAVSVAVMLLKKGSVERFCKTKIRTKFRDSPCESVCEFLHELCVLHIFVVCAGQVHVRHDPISRNFLRQFISRSLQVSHFMM